MGRRPDPYTREDAPRDDAILVARVRLGDEAAFEALFRRYYDRLRQFAYTCVARGDVAEELVQNVFASIWQHRSKWTVAGTVQAYLFGAVRKGALNTLRHERVTDRHAAAMRARQDEALAAPADTVLEHDELQRAITAAIAALPPRTREVFVLHRQQHLSHAEIAAATDMTLKGVEYHMGAALRALRKRLARFGP